MAKKRKVQGGRQPTPAQPTPASASPLFPEGELNYARRGHSFVSPDVLDTVPPIYDEDGCPLEVVGDDPFDPTLYLHFKTPGRHWYVAGLDVDTGEAYGYVDLGPMYDPEWGYFDLRELECLVTNRGDIVRRDLRFKPKKLNKARPPLYATYIERIVPS